MRLEKLAIVSTAILAGCAVIKTAQENQEILKPYSEEGPHTNELHRVVLRDFSLGDYVKFAQTNQPAIFKAELAVRDAELQIVQVDSSLYPQVSVSGGHSQSTANRNSHFSWHNSGKATGDVSLDWLICDFGRIDAQHKAAEENLIAAIIELDRVRKEAYNSVASAYFTLLQKDALLEAAKTNEVNYAIRLDQAERKLEAQEAKKLDVLRARLDLSDAVLQTASASNDVVTAEAQFVEALGLEADQARREDVWSSHKADLFNVVREIPQTTVTAEDALALAREKSFSIREKRAKLRAAMADVDYAIADLYPKITFSSAFDFSNPAWNWTWGFKGVQSLFNGFSKRTAVKQATLAMHTAKLDLDETEQSISRQLSVAVGDRDVARQNLETARVKLKQAKENLDTVMSQYKLGDASRVDVTDAVASYTSAIMDRINAFHAGQIAEANIVTLSGMTPSFVYENDSAESIFSGDGK